MDLSRWGSRERRADVVALILIVFLVAVLAIKWAGQVIWSPDALFYQSRVEQIRGASEQEALHKVWDGPLAAGFRADDSLRIRADQALADPRWIPESYKLYARRWTVPVMAAAVYPIFGVNSLEAVNVAGTLVFALALFVLLRLRFGSLPSFIGVAAVLAWPDLRWAFLPLDDAWGLAVLTICFWIGIRALDSWSRGWLVAWIVAMLVLSVTRELTLIPVVGAAAVALVLRSRPALILAGTGALATVPAQLLIHEKPVNWYLAYAFSGNRIPADSSWGFVLSHYWSNLEAGTRQSVDYLFSSNPVYLESAWPLWPFTVPLFMGLILVWAIAGGRTGDAYLPFMRGAFLGAVLLILFVPTFQDLRHEFTWLPISAVGVAIAAELLRGWIARAGPMRARPDNGSGPEPDPSPQVSTGSNGGGLA